MRTQQTLTRRELLQRGAVLGASLSAAQMLLPEALALISAPDLRPNILIVIADDLGYGDAGFCGCRDIPTPHMNALAAAGTIFSHAYAAAPMCAPSRMSAFTGQMPIRLHHECNPPHPTGAGPDINLFRALKKAGYYRGWIGKWHLAGIWPPRAPAGCLDYSALTSGWTPHMVNPDAGGAIIENGVPNNQYRGYEPEVLADLGKAFIQRAPMPWFLVVAPMVPHIMPVVPPEYLQRVQHITNPHRRGVAGMVVALDDCLGHMSAALKATQQEKRTLQAFWSDNGAHIVFADTLSNRPFRGGKNTLWEGGIRIPFVLRGPNIPAGHTISTPVVNTDLYPTILATAGTRPPKGYYVDGINLLQALKRPNHDRILSWRSVSFPLPAWAARCGQWKLLWPVNQPPQLYDIVRDPGETRNVARENGGIIERFRQHLLCINQIRPLPPFEKTLRK